MATTAHRVSNGPQLQNIGAGVLRYGLAIILVSVGALKFAAYESFAAAGFFLNSPLLSWIAPDIVSVRAFSGFIGVTEITLGLLIATRAFSPRLSALGSIGAIFVFLLTMTFVFSTPGVWQPGYGFPYPSPAPGQFLLKDLLLLGAAIWTAGETLGAARRASG
jgi:reactive chlorine resistance protein C